MEKSSFNESAQWYISLLHNPVPDSYTTSSEIFDYYKKEMAEGNAVIFPFWAFCGFTLMDVASFLNQKDGGFSDIMIFAHDDAVLSFSSSGLVPIVFSRVELLEEEMQNQKIEDICANYYLEFSSSFSNDTLVYQFVEKYYKRDQRILRHYQEKR